MGIDIHDLAPWAQKQAAEKILAQQREKAQNTEKPPQTQKQPKYHNTLTERIADGGKTIKFDSQKEARRFDELLLMLQAGEIKDLKLQPQYTLQEAYTTPEGNRVQAIRYQADFSYMRRDPAEEESAAYWGFDCKSWVSVVEDVKSKATKTRVYAMKKKLMHERFGITITEIE